MNAVQLRNLSSDEREHYFPEFEVHGNAVRREDVHDLDQEELEDNMRDAVDAMDEAIQVLQTSRAIIESSF